MAFNIEITMPSTKRKTVAHARRSSFGNAPPWPAKPPLTATEIRKAAGITKAEFAFTMKLAKQLGFE